MTWRVPRLSPDSGRPTARAPRIASLLLALGAVAAVPFLALTTYFGVDLVAQERRTATADLERSVEVTVNSVERLLGRTRVLLRGLSQRELARALDPARCDPALLAVLRLNVDYTNVFTVDASGTRLCSAVTPPPGTAEKVDPALYLDAVRTQRAFVIGPPSLGAVSGKWAVYAAEPIFRDGELAGVVGVGLDLKALTSALDPRTLPAAGVVAIVNAQGAVVTRHPDAQYWIARDASRSPAVIAARTGQAEVLRATGLDGVDRYWAHRSVRHTDWLVFAGVPSDAVLTEPRRKMALILGLGALITLGVGIASLALARRISSPIEAIAAAAPLLAKEGAKPLVPSGPAEAVTLAEELNRMQAERKAMDAGLREERSRLEGLVGSAMDAVITVDESHRIVLFNPAAERMFGVDADAALGTTLERFIPARLRSGHAAHMREFAATGTTTRAMGSSRTVRGVDSSGREFPLEASISQVEVGGHRYLTAIVRDVTERVEADIRIRALAARLEQRVAQRTAELEAANKELQAFDYSISHDLRGPLGRIQGFAAALSEDCGMRLDDAGRKYLERIVATARQMDQLVSDMLALSTVSRTEIVRVDVDISALAVEILEGHARSDSSRRVHWRVEPGLRASADAGLVRIVLDNLLANAWKFTSRREEAHIEVGAAPIGGRSAFFVRDDGAGFDPAAAQRLFEPFRRLHTQAEFQGTGVGLATVRRIVRRHGGWVRAEGEAGAGATFYFAFEP